MREIFADSFYWIALANPKDQWHQAATDFSRANQEATLVTTDEVLVEFLNYFAEAGGYTRRGRSDVRARDESPKYYCAPPNSGIVSGRLEPLSAAS